MYPVLQMRLEKDFDLMIEIVDGSILPNILIVLKGVFENYHNFILIKN